MNTGTANMNDAPVPRMILIGFIVAVVTLVGCTASVKEHTQKPPVPAPVCCKTVDAISRRGAIVQTAAKLVGATTIQVNGRRIAYDCAGVTRAVYLEHGIDLYDSGSSDPNANGVRLIYNHISRHGRFHQGPAVHPGDLVFFDNTWDYNGDGMINDPLTHVGIVERQEPDGTIIFISRVADAIQRYHMNLALPHLHKTSDGRILNDYIRRRELNDPLEAAYLAAELFAEFGTDAGL